MCGVVGIVYGRDSERLGAVGSFLLRKLEYRGYDSTGAAFLRRDGGLTLRKKVGSPTRVVHELGLEKLGGCRFIGQVRWATYGAVTDVNAQPHEVSCRARLVGAHNGNLSNTDTLKEFLAESRHRVASDNDGEMLVHLVEHYYHEQRTLREPGADGGEAARVEDLLQAVQRAHRKAVGSYAACVTVPDIEGIVAVKAGSSLYAGQGSDEDGDFIVVSSDLTSVLAKTRFLIPLLEGQGLYFTAGEYFVFSLRDGARSVPGLKRSKLNIADIALQPRFHFFMEQEIDSTAANLDTLRRYYFASEWEEPFFAVCERHARDCKESVFELLKLYAIFDRRRLRQALERLVAAPRFAAIAAQLAALRADGPGAGTPDGFVSDEAQLLRELGELAPEFEPALFALDRIVVWKKKRKVIRYRDRAVALFRDSFARGNRVFFVGAGTSYHAALCAGYFFNNLTALGIIPCNPDLFRSVHMSSLRPGDVLVAISQSGETKDLVDILNAARERFGDRVAIIAVVNNENSTIPQEKADFFLPLLCGPEIAVAATKSFSAQLALFYLLACSLSPDGPPPQQALERAQQLIGQALRTCEEDVTEVMLKFFLKPSLHLLGTSLVGLAREGALKIREVVLNHAEGYDAAEFKHGPNTILGRSTLYSFRDFESLLADMAEFCWGLLGGGTAAAAFLQRVRDLRFADPGGEAALGGDPVPRGRRTAGTADLPRRFRERVNAGKYFSNYPLIFLCPPVERDVRITISQIHTHKIRGADVVLIAEENAELAKAVEGRPAGLDGYFCKFIKVPASGDPNLFVFAAAVVLQRLALKMSVAKMKYLNRARVENHGVHPDVPKNVSKSITVD